MSPREELEHIAHVVGHRLGGFAAAIIALFALGWGLSSFSSGETLTGIGGIVVGIGLLAVGYWALNKGQEKRESKEDEMQEDN